MGGRASREGRRAEAVGAQWRHAGTQQHARRPPACPPASQAGRQAGNQARVRGAPPGGARRRPRPTAAAGPRTCPPPRGTARPADDTGEGRRGARGGGGRPGSGGQFLGFPNKVLDTPCFREAAVGARPRVGRANAGAQGTQATCQPEPSTASRAHPALQQHRVGEALQLAGVAQLAVHVGGPPARLQRRAASQGSGRCSCGCRAGQAPAPAQPASSAAAATSAAAASCQHGTLLRAAATGLLLLLLLLLLRLLACRRRCLGRRQASAQRRCRGSSVGCISKIGSCHRIGCSDSHVLQRRGSQRQQLAVAAGAG